MFAFYHQRPALVAWLALLGSIVLEVGATTLMKGTQGAGMFLEIAGVLGMLALLCVSYYLLARATLVLPIGVAFACWEGLGLALVSLSSVLVLGESLSWQRFFALVAVLSGVLLINYGTGHGPQKQGASS